MTTTAAPVLVDRADIHKSCKSLEGIVTVLASYTEAANTLASIQKKLAKALKEAASVKGADNVPANAMISSAGILEGLAEVGIKFAKIADRETENMSGDLKKWFKKLAKEEKAHDERMAAANARIKQAGQAYEKKSKKKDRDAAEEHSRYVAILNSVGPEMSQDKHNHTLFVTQRHTATLSSLAASLSRLAEAEWMRSCEIVRRSAPYIGTVGEWRVLCEGGWTGSLPSDLPDLDKDKHELDAIITSIGVQSAISGLDIGPTHDLNEYPESPTSSSNSKIPQSTRKSSASHQSAEQTGAQSGIERPPSTPPTGEPVTNVLKKKSPYSDPEQKGAGSLPVSRPTITTESVNVAASLISAVDSASDVAGSSTTSRGSDQSNAAQTQIASTSYGGRVPLEPEHQGWDHANTTKREVEPLHSPLSQGLSPVSRDGLSTERMQHDGGRKANVDTVIDRKTDRPTIPSLDYNKPSGTMTPTNGGGGGILHRRTSIDSTVSRVATMRERYTTGPSQPASSPPRDLPRPSQKVADLATRYTPIETSASPSRNHTSSFSQPLLSADRFSTFQERYPRFDRDKDRFRGSPEPIPEPAHFERDKERYRYVATSILDRNQFLQDDRDNERHHSLNPHNPDNTQRLDELGVRVRERPQRIDIAEELALQEREAELYKQRRQLEADRTRLANARNENGYISDTNRGYHGPAYAGPKYLDLLDSPMHLPHSRHPPQNSPPPDHSPSCGCQRCSAQHYASASVTPRTRRDSAAAPDPSPIYKPEPPILLRPEKPKNWIRRMSMPVTSIVSSNDKKNATIQSVSNQTRATMVPPEEDGRIRRRSFESDNDREPSARFGGTARRS